MRRPFGHLLRTLAVTALATLAVAPALPVAAAEPSFRSPDLALQDVCTDGLPWTAHAPLGLPARKPRDEEGVPMILVRGTRYYRPGALAINGMKRIDAYRDTGDKAQLEQALRQAEVLRSMALDRRGAAWLPFWYDYLPAGQRAPWFNAMVQGLVLSFYVRLHDVTADAVHLEAAHEVSESFLRLGRKKRTWVAYVDGRGNLWLEHYPRRRPDHVLNAHLHAIFGIYEYWQVTRSPRASRVLRGAIGTLLRNVDRYRRPGGVSLYGLRSRTRIVKYHEIHVWQLNLLARISGEATFARVARRLARDLRPTGEVPGRPARHGTGIVGPHCRPDGFAGHGRARPVSDAAGDAAGGQRIASAGAPSR